jgi:hypothetical protein
MSDQPERIWATQYMQANAPFSGGVQYIRADVVEAMVAAERERCARVVEKRLKIRPDFVTGSFWQSYTAAAHPTSPL